MKKSFLSCGGMFLIFVVIVVIGSVFGLNALLDGFKKDILAEMGFSSQQEFDEFANEFSKDIDITEFYVNIYDESDKQYVKNTLDASINLASGAELILDNGYINVTALDEENNASLLQAMAFSEKQFAYLENLLFASIFADTQTENNEFSDIAVLSYTLNTSTNHSTTLKLNTTELKQSFDEYGKALPNDLYIILNYDIIVTEKGKYQATNISIQFNKLNENYNKQAINFFKAVLQAEPAKVFSDLIITMINSFDTTIKSKTIFEEEQILMEAYDET